MKSSKKKSVLIKISLNNEIEEIFFFSAGRLKCTQQHTFLDFYTSFEKKKVKEEKTVEKF